MAQLPLAQAVIALLAMSALALAGCGLGAGRAPSGVQLLVTQRLRRAARCARRARPQVRGQETVMSLLMRNYAVSTRYCGRLRAEHRRARRRSRRRAARSTGSTTSTASQAPKGAAATNVHPGDHIWWDRHDWSQTEQVPAVVGSFPEPFLNGLEGKRLPVRIECAPVGRRRVPDGRRPAARGGVPVAIAGAGRGAGPNTLRVLVGHVERRLGRPRRRDVMRGPRASGVYARFAAGGRSLALLDADGRAARTLGAGAGLVAATRREEDAPVWVVTGTDEAGVELAARALDERDARAPLRRRARRGRARPLPRRRPSARAALADERQRAALLPAPRQPAARRARRRGRAVGARAR